MKLTTLLDQCQGELRKFESLRRINLLLILKSDADQYVQYFCLNFYSFTNLYHPKLDTTNQ